MTPRPLGDRVIVKPKESEKVTASGIVIPETASGEKPQEGTVIALGIGGTYEKCPDPSAFLKEGDRVLFNMYAGDDITLVDGDTKTDVKVLRLDSILAVL